jgi:hypothetical protein
MELGAKRRSRLRQRVTLELPVAQGVAGRAPERGLRSRSARSGPAREARSMRLARSKGRQVRE